MDWVLGWLYWAGAAFGRDRGSGCDGRSVGGSGGVADQTNRAFQHVYMTSHARRTTDSTRSAANSAGSCSQILTTVQPRSASRRSVSSSRARFASSFVRHHSLFDRGFVPCSGQPCQKHPSTKTATCTLVKAMSIVRRRCPGSGKTTRYRRPRLWSSRRRASSAAVSRRLAVLIRLDTS